MRRCVGGFHEKTTSQNWNKLVTATVGEQAYRETGQFPKVACWGVVAS